MDEDVPSPIDLRSMRDAEAWTESALRKRPCRTRFFEAIIDVVAARERGTAARRVLELGSGPGFLLERLVSAVPGVEVVALDFCRPSLPFVIPRPIPLALCTRAIA